MHNDNRPHPPSLLPGPPSFGRATTRTSAFPRRAVTAGVVLVATILTACTGAGQPEQPAPASASASASASSTVDTVADRAARSEALLTSTLDATQPGCSAAAAIDGHIVWAGARGMANLEQNTPLTTDTRFDIASVSKQFTATAVLLLSFDGALSLQDPLSKYVHGLPGWADQVTIDQLIHHTSGIPDYLQEFTRAGITYDQPTTQQDAVAAIAAIPQLPVTPGTTFEYSNSNYLLLADVAAAASGTPLPELLQDRVFDPLDLNMVMQPGLQGPDVATGYWSINGTSTPVVAHWTQIGDGSIYTTPSDLVRWADNYRTGRLGGQEFLTAVTANAVPQGTPAQPNPMLYGAGIGITPDGALGHPGGWAGYASFMSTSTDRHTTVAGSCNTEDLIDMPAVAGGLQSIWYD